MSAAPFEIRPYRPADEDAVYDVCLKTGIAGQDATHLYSDPKALGHIFVGPYLHLEPELAFVLEDSQGVCGYVLGALDSARFYRAYLERWLPELRKFRPDPCGNPAEWTPTEKAYHQYHHPKIYFPGHFRDYPSHLHIDLLPRAQGRGNGQRMMATLLERLRQLGATGVHLSMASTNSRAERFYQKLGFHELDRTGAGDEQTLYLVRKL
jgi:ribosomal protein S18 acetylase RimI-like enzyme